MSGWDNEQGEPDRTAVRSFESMGSSGAPANPNPAQQGPSPFTDGFGSDRFDQAGFEQHGFDQHGFEEEPSGGRGRFFLWLLLAAVVVGLGVAGTLFFLDRNSSTSAADEAAYVATDDTDAAGDTEGTADGGAADGTGTDTEAVSGTPQFAPTATPVAEPTPTVTPAPIIDCIGDVPCCVTGPYLPITEDTVGIAFEALVEPTESFAVRYIDEGPVGGFEFNDEDWFDFERLGETGIDRFLVAPRSSLTGVGCDFGTDSGDAASPVVGVDGTLPVLIVDGIGDLTFGTSTVDDALAAFEPLLGPATVEGIVECPSGGDEAVAWDALQMVFREGRLEGWFYDGRFETEPRLVTPSGVSIAMSEADMAFIYDGVTIEETSIGREFWYEVPSGVMSGLISEGQVASLWAGGVCIFR